MQISVGLQLDGSFLGVFNTFTAIKNDCYGTMFFRHYGFLEYLTNFSVKNYSVMNEYASQQVMATMTHYLGAYPY